MSGVLERDVVIFSSEQSADNRFRHFCERIGRPEIKEVLTPATPWVCFSNEFGLDGMSATGGLGILAGDWVKLARRLGIPFVGIGPFHTSQWKQDMVHGFWQVENYQQLTPESSGFSPVEIGGQRVVFDLSTNGASTAIHLLAKNYDGVLVYALYEPNLGILYAGDSQDEHRLYQATVLGFGGVKALERLGLEPAIFHLNESSAAVAAVAYLDSLVQSGCGLEKALETLRTKTIFTNHTLVSAAEQTWSRWQIENYLIPNLEEEAVRSWLYGLVEEGGVNLGFSTLAFALAGRVNGVSRSHAKIAKSRFNHDFTPITNGIDWRWVDPAFLSLLQDASLIDEFGLPTEDYIENLDRLVKEQLMAAKAFTQEQLREYLPKRRDQYGEKAIIPEGAKIMAWARRFGDYKRPYLMFYKLDHLAKALAGDGRNIHLIFAGKAHPTDDPMKLSLQFNVKLIDSHPVLRERVHFIKDYDQELARYLVAGADVWLNTPRPGEEACGSSVWKAIANLALLISTIDGGPADPWHIPGQHIDDSNLPFLTITDWGNEENAADSLYLRMVEAAEIFKDPVRWSELVRRQLRYYLPTICGSRMMAEYLRLIE